MLAGIQIVRSPAYHESIVGSDLERRDELGVGELSGDQE